MQISRVIIGHYGITYGNRKSLDISLQTHIPVHTMLDGVIIHKYPFAGTNLFGIGLITISYTRIEIQRYDHPDYSAGGKGEPVGTVLAGIKGNYIVSFIVNTSII